MSFLDRIKNRASSIIDTGRDTLRAATRPVTRTANRASRAITNEVKTRTRAVANTARRELNDTSSAVGRTTRAVANTARREWNDTSNAVGRTTRAVANTARRGLNNTSNAVGRTTRAVANTARRELNDTSSTVRRTTRAVANTTRREWNNATRTAANSTSERINTLRNPIRRTTNTLRNTARNVKETLIGNPENIASNTRDTWRALTNPNISWSDRSGIVSQWWDETQPQSGFMGHYVDYEIGVAEGAWNMGRGLWELSQNPALNPNAMVSGMIRDPQGTMQTTESTYNGIWQFVKNPAVQQVAIQTVGGPVAGTLNYRSRPQETQQAFTDIKDAFLQPYVEDWENGHPGQSIGRGVFDIGSLFIPIPGGGIAVTGAGRVANIASRTSSVGTRVGRETAETTARVSKPKPRITQNTPTTRTNNQPWYENPNPGSNYVTDELDRTMLSVHRIDGKQPPGRRKEDLRGMDIPGIRPDDHRGHLGPEGLVTNTDRVNTRYNIIPESPRSNLSAKRKFENIASRIKSENPDSNIYMSSEPLYVETERRPVAVTHSILNDRGEELYEMTIFNIRRGEAPRQPNWGGVFSRNKSSPSN